MPDVDQEEAGTTNGAQAPAEEEAAPLPAITSAAGWRRASQQRHKVGLPSGVVVLARKLDPTALIVEGILDGDGVLEAMRPTSDPETLRQRVETARMVATRVVVEPPVVLENSDQQYPEGAMVASMIPPVDALALFAWSLGNGSLVTTELVADEG